MLTTGQQYDEGNDEEYNATDDVHRFNMVKNFKNYASYDQGWRWREREERRKREREREGEG